MESRTTRSKELRDQLERDESALRVVDPLAGDPRSDKFPAYVLQVRQYTQERHAAEERSAALRAELGEERVSDAQLEAA